ncbi:MAG: peptidoglycan-binding protein, partial [Propylenella sp.]
AKLYADGSRPWHDLARAAAAYREAADAGDIWSKISLARLFAAGRGVRANFDGAIALLDEVIAVDPNSETAADVWRLKGDLYRGAKLRQRDPVKAAEAYQKAADLGETWSLVYLAEMLTTGDGIPVDRERARNLLVKAAARSSESQGEALAALGDFYRVADQPTYDLDVALGYYRTAAGAGVGKAHLAVVEITSDAVQTPEDLVAMRKHLKAAANSLGADLVGKAMFKLSPPLFYSLVQEMLTEAGYSPGTLDGVYGRQTRQAARAFCASERIASCGGDFVTLSLLKGLLETGG